MDADLSDEELGSLLGGALERVEVGCVIAGQGRVIYASPCAAALLGRPLEALVGGPMPDPLEGDARDVELALPRADGTSCPVQVSRSRVELDGRSLAVAFIRDVSDQRRVHEALASSEARFRAIVEVVGDGVYIERDGALLYANPAMATILGYGDANEVPRGAFADLVHPDDWPLLAGSRAGDLPCVEVRASRRDGRTVVLEVVRLEVVDPDGTAQVGFARDVTRRASLRARVLEQDRLATMGTVAAGVAHEVNNPLTYVLASLDLAMRGIGPDEAGPLGEARRRLAEARAAGAQVATTLRELLAVSRADVGREKVDLGDILAGVAQLRQVDRRVRVKLTLQGTPVLRGSPARLRQLFLNLLLHVAARARSREVEVRVRTDPGWVVVEIDHDAQTIEPRGGAVDSRSLGVAVAEAIVAEMGGTLRARPREGGRLLEVCFPVDAG